MSHIVTIDASPTQLSKLRKGHPVRIKKGTGFNLIVHPETYHILSKAFNKSKGAEIALSPEEIEMNRNVSPEQHAELKKANPEIAGTGIFGKKFDKALKKAGIKKLAYAVGDEIKPMAKAGIVAGLTSGATALGAVQPELIPLLPVGVAGISALASDYLDKPGKYQSGIRAKPVRSLAEKAVKAKINEKINDELGTNYDYMSRAGLENALANSQLSDLNRASYAPRFSESPNVMYGSGFHRKEVSTRLSGRGTLHPGSQPPALQSQPYASNFQFQHFLPPAYQKYSSGSGLYAGRAGHGLYA